MSDIFISYASEDRSRAEKLAKKLEEQGWSVWWDKTITPGKTFDQVIQEAMDSATCVVVLWSKKSINSDWVKEEANIGKERKILVPAKIDPVDPPIGFGRIQAADLTDWEAESIHPGFTILLSAISEIVGPLPLKVKETVQKREEEQKRREIKAEIKPEKLGPAKAKPPESKLDATAIAERESAKLRKSNHLLKFTAMAGVIVLLLIGTWWSVFELLPEGEESLPETEIVYDFEDGKEGWGAVGGTIDWVKGKDLEDYDVCNGCQNPFEGQNQPGSSFIHWINGGNGWEYYRAPDSIKDRLSEDYAGGTLEFWILHDRIDGSADYRANIATVVLYGTDGKLSFTAPDYCYTLKGYLNEVVCHNQVWQYLQISLDNDKYTFDAMNNDHTSGNCWVLDDKKQCASNEEIRNFLGNVTRMQIRAEYWYGGDTSFLDDVIIKKPDS